VDGVGADGTIPEHTFAVLVMFFGKELAALRAVAGAVTIPRTTFAVLVMLFGKELAALRAVEGAVTIPDSADVVEEM
jgi:hypothetical protein